MLPIVVRVVGVIKESKFAKIAQEVVFWIETTVAVKVICCAKCAAIETTKLAIASLV